MLITAGFLLSTFVVYQFMPVSFSAMISGFAMIAEEVGIEEPSVLCLGLKRASKLSVPFNLPNFTVLINCEVDTPLLDKLRQRQSPALRQSAFPLALEEPRNPFRPGPALLRPSLLRLPTLTLLLPRARRILLASNMALPRGGKIHQMWRHGSWPNVHHLASKSLSKNGCRYWVLSRPARHAAPRFHRSDGFQLLQCRRLHVL